MNLTSTQWRLLAGLAGLVLCGGLVALVLSSRDDATVLSLDTGVSSTTTAPESATTTTSSATTSEPTTSLSADTTTTVEDTEPNCEPSRDGLIDPSCFDATGLERRLVAELTSGVQLIRYAESTDTDCAAGTLVAEADDSIIAVYDLPFAGGVRALPSQFGPTALIGSCEEWIEWVAFYDDPITPSVPPIITVHDIPDDIFFLWEFEWVGLTGYLGATASFSTGSSPATTSSVVIDPADGSIRIADDVFGRRSARSPDGFDVLIPDGWEVVEENAAINVVLTESGSRLRVEATTPGTTPTAGAARADETVDAVAEVETTIWSGDDGVAPDDWASGTETRFVSAVSTRYVREFDLADRIITMELEIANGVSRGEIYFALYVMEQVRVFSSVG